MEACPFDLVMFDLDGTLLDTLCDIASATNHVLEEFNHPTHPTEHYRFLAGQGVYNLYAAALNLPADSPEILPLIERHHDYYRKHQFDTTKPFPGIPELLGALHERGIKTAILSNKPDKAVQEVVAHFFADAKFAVVQGQREGVPVKPDPTGALLCAQNVGVLPSRVLYVGDTRADMETARAAGFTAVGVSWGFRDVEELVASGAHHIVHSALELLALLAAQPAC